MNPPEPTTSVPGIDFDEALDVEAFLDSALLGQAGLPREREYEEAHEQFGRLYQRLGANSQAEPPGQC